MVPQAPINISTRKMRKSKVFPELSVLEKYTKVTKPPKTALELNMLQNIAKIRPRSVPSEYWSISEPFLYIFGF
jgi:hypothetical protein